ALAASAGECRSRGVPSRITRPPEGRSAPAIIFNSVDLPAPLAPSRQCTSPRRTVSEACSRATMFMGKRLETFSTTSTSSAIASLQCGAGAGLVGDQNRHISGFEGCKRHAVFFGTRDDSDRPAFLFQKIEAQADGAAVELRIDDRAGSIDEAAEDIAHCALFPETVDMLRLDITRANQNRFMRKPAHAEAGDIRFRREQQNPLDHR